MTATLRRAIASGFATRCLCTAALVAALVATLAANAAVAAIEAPTDQPSDEGLFLVSVQSRTEPVPLNELHAWTVHVEDADGRPIDGAAISVSGGMPMHDHGLPTEPRITESLGGGDYLLEGVKFQMPGHWTVTLAIEADERRDSVTFSLQL